MKKYCLAGVIILCLGSAVLANPFASFCGCVSNSGPYVPGGPLSAGTYGTVRDAGGNPLASGSPHLVQYIYVGSDSYINDPDASGNVRAADNLVNITAYYVGDDSDSGATFTGTPGKFFHGFLQNDAAEYSAVAASANQFYVRAWDRDPADPAALYGDSDLFSPSVGGAGAPPPLPNNVGLGDFKVQFSKAAPAAPVVGSASGISAAPPSATVNWTSAIGARSYTYQVTLSTDVTYASPVATGTIYNSSRHAASVDNSTAKSAGVTLGTFGDDKTYRFRVKASNDFGDSAWVEGSTFYVPPTPSGNRPVAVSDLRVAASDATSLTIRWTAPYYVDGHGTQQAATGYDIRIAKTPILDSWNLANSNYYGLTTWAGATPINSAPYGATVPAPQMYHATQEVKVPCPPGTYFVALKSSGAINASYISNVTGAQVGSGGGYGGGELQNWLLSIQSQVDSGGHGINHFSMPFPAPWYAYKEDGTTLLGTIASAYDLVKAINAAYGSNIVSTFTKWVGASSTPNETAVIISDNNPDAAGVAGALQAIALDNGTAYELYASKPVRIVIKNY
jgi:hypothetical protein